MLPICYICLRTNIKTRTLDDDLDSYYEEICEYILQLEIQCCEQCIRKLKDCYDFKQRCLLAAKILKSWRCKKLHKSPLHRLYKQLPVPMSKLAFSNKRNFNVYICVQKPDILEGKNNDKTDLINTKSNLDYPHVFNISIPQTDTQMDSYFEDTPIESIVENGNRIKEESIDILAFDNKDTESVWRTINERLEFQRDDVTYANDELNNIDGTNDVLDSDDGPNDVLDSDDGPNDILVNDDGTNDALLNNDGTNDILNNDESLNDESNESNDSLNNDVTGNLSDSDTSLNNLIERFEKKISEMNNLNMLSSDKVKRKDINKEDLKKKIRDTFVSYGEVKDKTGKAIDMNIVLYSLDILSMKKVLSVDNVCGGDGPFSEEAIDKLTELQNLYGKYNKRGFTIECIHDDAQMRIEFEKRRESSKYVKSKHRCESCIRGFKTDKTLEHHMKTVHNKSNTFECKLCKSNHSSRARLLVHMKEHRLLYKCKTCPFVTSNRNNIQPHCNVHDGRKYICKECGQNFDFEKSLYSHKLRSHHHSKHTCQLCAFNAVSALGLRFHMKKTHHVNNEQFVISESNKKCDICNVTLLNDEVYQKHLAISHSDVPKKRRKVIKDRKVNEEIKRKKERSASYSCHLCDSVGYNPWWLSRHLKNIHPDDKAAQPLEKKHLCAVCGKVFANQYIYKDHINTHTGVRPYSCDKCPKSFYTKATLRVHTLRHLPPMYLCRHCGNKFPSAANLYNHVRGHIRDRRFKCEICGKGFIHKSAMREHVRGVHLNIKRVKKSRKN